MALKSDRKDIVSTSFEQYEANQVSPFGLVRVLTFAVLSGIRTACGSPKCRCGILASPRTWNIALAMGGQWVELGLPECVLGQWPLPDDCSMVIWFSMLLSLGTVSLWNWSCFSSVADEIETLTSTQAPIIAARLVRAHNHRKRYLTLQNYNVSLIFSGELGC